MGSFVDGLWQLSDDELAEGFPEPLPRQEDHLAKAHTFARDARVKFVEDGHYYLVTNSNGEVVRAPVSVTGLLDRFKRKFDADAASRGLGRRSDKYKRPDGSPMTDEEIRASWSKLGKVASIRGTLMHYQIEQYFNGRPPADPLSPEMRQFLDFEAQEIRGKGLSPFRTEMSIFHCGLSIAGQCDMLCKAPDGGLFLLDWKRCKSVDMESFRGERMKSPLDHLDHCKFIGYALQLNLYRFILESEYGVIVCGMALGVFHPQRSEYQFLPVPKMDREISLIVSHLKAQGVASDPRPDPDASFCGAALEEMRGMDRKRLGE